MRIGLVAPPWAPVPPKLYGGIELIVDRLARGFADAGHEVRLFATGDSTCPVPTSSVLPLAEGMRIGAALVELRHALAAHDELRDCDIIHDHTLAGPLISRGDIPVVTTVHGPLDAEWTDVYRSIATRAHVVCISHAQRLAAPDLAVRAVIHHGIDAGEFPFGAGPGGYALFLGRMSPDKGAHRAIAAARQAGFPILLAAKMRTGEERIYYDEHIAPMLGPDATYLGEVPHEHKLELLGGAAALLFPIRWPEPFGLVMLEALASGTPVIAFPEGAAPEVVDHGVTGYLVDSVDEMAAALGKVAHLDRAACRASVEGPFSAARMVAEHLSLFADLIASR
jgi:glycosyltransferase involved in cell wall biosynthesis